MIKKLLYLTFGVLFIVSLHSLQAQARFGVRAGLNLADINGNAAGESYGGDSNMKIGFHVGVMADVPLSETIFFQPSLLYSTKGFEIEEEDSGLSLTSTTNINYLEVPLNFVYRIETGGANINLGLGPYVGFALGGTIEAEVSGSGFGFGSFGFGGEEDLEFGNDPVEDDYRALDYGLNIVAGVDISKFTINLQYGLGLANLRPEGDSDNSARNSVFGVSVGYYFLGE